MLYTDTPELVSGGGGDQVHSNKGEGVCLPVVVQGKKTRKRYKMFVQKPMSEKGERKVFGKWQLISGFQRMSG